MKPYSDEFIYYDTLSGRYVLTEKDLIENLGLDIRTRLGENATVSPEIVIKRICKRASDLIYGYIHNHSVDDTRLDNIIACIPRAREVVREAMENQILFMNLNGDWSLSPKQEERDNCIDQAAITWLNTVIPEIGQSLLYTGY